MGADVPRRDLTSCEHRQLASNTRASPHGFVREVPGRHAGNSGEPRKDVDSLACPRYLLAMSEEGRKTPLSLSSSRERAQHLWVDVFGSGIPGYFLDRLATRIRQDPSINRDAVFAGIPRYSESEQANRLELRTHPLIGEAFPPPIDAPPSLTSWGLQLLESWEGYLQSMSVAFPPGHFDLKRFRTLQDGYEASVYFPGPVAIDGPGFLDALGEDAPAVIEKYGVDRVIDFTIVMCFAHEWTHMIQKGEPLLCEYILSVMWVDFIQKQGLTDLQVNSSTGLWVTLEEPFHVGTSVLLAHMDVLMDDTLNIARVLSGEQNEGAYSRLCDLGHRLDSKELAYRKYLELLAAELTTLRSGT